MYTYRKRRTALLPCLQSKTLAYIKPLEFLDPASVVSKQQFS
jgi:hypothetical protein